MTYTVRFKNSTPNAYHFALYQKFPDSPGLDSVAWQVRGLGASSTNRVDWSLNYQVAIADWDANAQQYSGRQLVAAQLTQVYTVEIVQEDIPSINPTPTGSTSKRTIKLVNNTNPARTITTGFAVSNKLIAAEKAVSAGETTMFSVHPTYYIACYRNIEEGQLVSEGVELNPVELTFKDEYKDYTVEAATEDGTMYLKNPVPTPSA